MPASYPLDTSGVNPTNLISDELHTVSEGQFRDYHFLVPDLAPFFVDNFTLKLSAGGIDTLLHEDVDYSFVIPYVTGTRTTGKQMYGGVTLHNLDNNGLLKMTYQTVGGDQVVDRLYVLTTLAEKAYNPRTTIFDIITNVPNAFPPVPHYQDYSSFFGQEEVVTALNAIVTAIATNASLTGTTIHQFLTEFNSGSSVNYVNRGGDTMVGPLTLSGVPTQPNQAASKQYVDSLIMSSESIASLLSNYITASEFATTVETLLAKTGGIMIGPLSVQTPTLPEHAVDLVTLTDRLSLLQSQIDQISATMGTTNGGFVTNLEFSSTLNEIRAQINHLKR